LDFADIDDATCDDLDIKISSLSAQLTAQKRLSETLKLIRENQPLPLRRLSYNLKKLCESGEFDHLGNVWKEQIWLIDMYNIDGCALSEGSPNCSAI